MNRSWLGLAAIMLSLLGCAPASTNISAAITPTPRPPLSPEAPVATETGRIEGTTTDGITIKGHTYGTGDVAVILAHMFPADQTSWTTFARTLAAKGYKAVTFDFRGYGDSSGRKEIPLIHRDLMSMLNEVSAAGAKKVFLIGASMGGTAAIKVASLKDVAGVVTLSAPQSFMRLSAEDDVHKVKAPALYIACHGDEQPARSVRFFEQRSQGRQEGIILEECQAHGTDLLQGPTRDGVEKLILDFLQENR